MLIFRLVYEIYDHFTAESNNFAQIYVKAENDWWIVFKKVKRYFFYVFYFIL